MDIIVDEGKPLMNLIDGLNEQLTRARELLKLYEGIPTGGFGAMMIRQAIEHAESSMRDGDTVQMIFAYKALEKLE